MEVAVFVDGQHVSFCPQLVAEFLVLAQDVAVLIIGIIIAVDGQHGILAPGNVSAFGGIIVFKPGGGSGAQLGGMADLYPGCPEMAFVLAACFDDNMKGGILIFGFADIAGGFHFLAGGKTTGRLYTFSAKAQGMEIRSNKTEIRRAFTERKSISAPFVIILSLFSIGIENGCQRQGVTNL